MSALASCVVPPRIGYCGERMDDACGQPSLGPRVVRPSCLAVLMQVREHIDELGEAEVLDRLDVLHVAQRRAESEVLLLAVQFAILHDEQTLDPQSLGLDGREKAIHYGGAGTPLVTEFCAADFGARLQLTPWAAHRLIGDALDLKHRLPQLWRRVQALEVKVSYARHVARKTRDLQPDEAAYVDSRVVEVADGRVTWTRFEQLVDAAIAAADPVAAAERERAARERSFARATRSTEDGMRGFYIRAAFPIIARLDATIAHLAEALKALGEDLPPDELRVLAVLVLANPHQAVRILEAYRAQRSTPTPDPADLLPQVVLYVHAYRGAEPTGIVRVEGVGPVTATWLRDTLGPHARFTVKHRPRGAGSGRRGRDPRPTAPGRAPDDAGRHLPLRLQHLLEPTDRPHRGLRPRCGRRCGSVAHRELRADDTRPPLDGGASEASVSKSPDHDLRAVDGHATFPSVFVWREPHGALFLVDHTGARRFSQGA